MRLVENGVGDSSIIKTAAKTAAGDCCFFAKKGGRNEERERETIIATLIRGDIHRFWQVERMARVV
jgi:hypothetical protein